MPHFERRNSTAFLAVAFSLTVMLGAAARCLGDDGDITASLRVSQDVGLAFPASMGTGPNYSPEGGIFDVTVKLAAPFGWFIDAPKTTYTGDATLWNCTDGSTGLVASQTWEGVGAPSVDDWSDVFFAGNLTQNAPGNGPGSGAPPAFQASVADISIYVDALNAHQDQYWTPQVSNAEHQAETSEGGGFYLPAGIILTLSGGAFPAGLPSNCNYEIMILRLETPQWVGAASADGNVGSASFTVPTGVALYDCGTGSLVCGGHISQPIRVPPGGFPNKQFAVVTDQNFVLAGCMTATFVWDSPLTGGPTTCQDYARVAPLPVATFQEDPAQTYGFDKYTSPQTPWKSVQNAQSDTANVSVNPSSSATIVCLTSDGTATMTISPGNLNGSPEQVTVTGAAVGTANAIARAPTTTGTNIGQMGVAVYAQVTKRLGIRQINLQRDDVQVIQPGCGLPSQICIGFGPNHILESVAAGDDQTHIAYIDDGLNGKTESVLGGDDVYVIPFGCGTPSQTCITPGANGLLDTVPVGTDVVSGQNIITGTCGICCTTAASTNLNSTPIDTNAVSNYLNNTAYNQAVVSWIVTPLPSMAVRYDLNLNGKLDDDGPLFPTAEEQVIIGNCDDASQDNVIFVVNGNTLGHCGVSAVSQRFAFVFPDVTPGPPQTCSHEMGHAAFGYDDLYSDTVNLMYHEYGADHWRLRKFQWDGVPR